MPIAADELAKPEAQKVGLLWASKTAGDTFWHDQLTALSADHPERFRHTPIFSREQRPGALHGRVNASVLAAVFDQAWGLDDEGRTGVRFLSVGTKQMMRETDEMLSSLGYHWSTNKLLP